MNALLRFAVLVVILWIGLAILPFFAAPDHETIALERILSPPSYAAWFGFDHLGRSMAAELIAGAHVSLLVALLVVFLSALIGTTIGILSAWYRGWVDIVLTTLTDIFMAFPGILLAIALAGVLGPGMVNLILALTIPGWVGFARVARAQVLAVREQRYVLAAVALGVNERTIMWRHLVPALLPVLIVQTTFDVGAIIITEASLSFLGIGVQPPMISWGGMVRDGVRYMLVAPHAVVIPGLAIFFVVLSINVLGDALRDHLDVKLAEKR